MPSFLENNILSLLTFLPLVGALVLMLLPRPKDNLEQDGGKLPPDAARGTIYAVAILFAALNFLLSVLLFVSFKSDAVNTAFQGTGRHIQYTELYEWITLGSINIRYHLGMDGISLLLVVLTTFLMTLCVVFSGNTRQRMKEFMIFLLLLETGMIGIFCALDLVLFYVFWEVMLIPMYFLIGIYGSADKIFAAVKFFLYTFAGSILMLVAIVATYQITGTFDVLQLSDHTTGPGAVLAGHDPRTLMLLFGAFALAFMVKVPMFPVHTWAPDVQAAAPTVVSIFLAGEVGVYGFVRFCLPMFPAQSVQAAPLFIWLSVFVIVYASIIAVVQKDSKRLIVYSSIAHVGLITLGIFSFTRVGMMGALIQNINHGITTGMLFFLVGMLYERRQTREIAQFGGLKKVTPMLAMMLLLATLSSLAVPFFNGFVGEFGILLGSWISQGVGYVPTALAATSMILSAVYMLWWFQRLMLGPVNREANRSLPDLSRTEWSVLLPLVGMIFWIGLGSKYFTQRMESAVNTLLPTAATSPAIVETTNPELPMSERLQQDSLAIQKIEYHSHLTTRTEPTVPQNSGSDTNANAPTQR